MKSNKILLVSEYFPPKIFGGGEISAYQLAKSLAEKNLEVFVLTSHFKKLKVREEKDGFVILRLLKTGTNPKTIAGNFKRTLCFQKSLKKQLFELDKQENFDVVHFLNTTSIPNFKIKNKTFATINGYTNFCPKRNMFYKDETVCSGCNPKKFVGCIMHSKVIGKNKLHWFLKYNPVFLWFLYHNYKKNNANLKNVKKYFGISGFIKQLLVKNGVKKNNIANLPNIIDIQSSDKRFDILEKGTKVTYIGPALGKFKGVEMLIRAFKNVRKNAKLLIFGDGPELDYLKEMAGENVRFYKPVPYEYLNSIFEQTDIIVHPAKWPEPLSRVTIETLHFGKPIIATDAGGNKDCLNDGVNGFLVHNEKELTDALQKLVNNTNLREKMGVESKKLFNQKFEPNKVLREIIEFYQSK